MTSAHDFSAEVRNCGALAAGFFVAVVAFGSLDQADAATVTRTGTVKVSGTIAVAGVPTTAVLSCGVSVNADDQAAAHSQSVSATATCTRSGNRATISLSLPYTFLFDRADVGSVTLSISVGASAFASPDYRVSTSTGYVVRLPASGRMIPVSVKLAL